MIERADVGRRRFLTMFAGVPVAVGLLAGCTGTGGAGKLPAAHPGPDVDARVRWSAIRSERSLLALHEAVLARHAGLSGVLEPLAGHHREHLAALLDDGPLPLLARPLLGLPDLDLSTVETPDIPDGESAALRAMRDAERDASDAHLNDCLRATGTRLAALLSSIAAAEAAHGATLGGT